MAKKPSKPGRDKLPSDKSVEAELLGRDSDGKFAGGWKGGPGGKREGSGRKPDAVRAMFNDFLERADDLAQARIMEILSGETKPNTLPDGTPIEGEYVLVVPPDVVFKTIKHVQEHRYGKATVHVKVEEDSGDILDTINRAKAAGIVAMGKEHQAASAARSKAKKGRNT